MTLKGANYLILFAVFNYAKETADIARRFAD